jgi:hypothetical protein
VAEARIEGEASRNSKDRVFHAVGGLWIVDADEVLNCLKTAACFR